MFNIETLLSPCTCTWMHLDRQHSWHSIATQPYSLSLAPPYAYLMELWTSNPYYNYNISDKTLAYYGRPL